MSLKRLICTVLVVGVCSLSSGCGSLPLSPLGILGGGSSNDGVQVGTEDITIGKKEEETAVNTQLGDNTESTQTADRIVNTVENSGLTTLQLLLIVLLAGWAIPDPQTMGRGILLFLQTLLPWGRLYRRREETQENP